MDPVSEIIKATCEDINDLEVLVETCYRGELSKLGWTTEADMFDGPRVTISMLQKDMLNPDVTIFKCDSSNHKGTEKIVCSVRTERHGDKLHLGMLCVHPTIQNGGHGRKLVERVESFARESGCRAVEMNVLLQRTELVAWYERQGFTRTGETAPLPAWEGNPSRHKCHLDFIVLEKEV